MTGNLIGETFDQWVFDQIKARQLLYGSGFKNSKLTNDQLLLLQNNNSFLKLASGVNIYTPVSLLTEEEFKESENFNSLANIDVEVDALGVSDDIGPSLGLTQDIAEQENSEYLKDQNNIRKKNNELQKAAAEKKLSRIGFSESEIKRLGVGSKLSESLVLFGGSSSLVSGKLKQRSGISLNNSLYNNSAYGLGGNKFGKQPMPAIISAEINCINRGSTRSATIRIKAFNQFQFDLIELLYLRLGYTMLLEWGHVNYVDNNNKRVKTGATLTETFWFTKGPHNHSDVLDKIRIQNQASNGNIDGFFGRVTNFNWSISPDGSYDINLELYTVGDVIESLQVNVPVDLTKITTKEEGGSLTILDKWMDTTVASMKEGGTEKQPLKRAGALKTSDGKTHYNYINLFEYNKTTASKKIYNLDDGWDETNRYFCTFRTLIEKIEEHTIPTIVGRTRQPLIEFDTSIETNIMGAQPNQVSFNLEICFIKPRLFYQGANPLTTFKNDDYFDFHQLELNSGGDLYYGKIMNIYLNFKFIKRQLRKNIDSKGRLSLYKFLKGICDGINDALGGVNQLEPIVKDDRKIVFIDQTQPRGNSKIINKLVPQIPEVKQTPFLLNGFKNGNKSNFIYNFSFESTISSDLATKLAIGATAGNTTVSITDGTGFSSYNTGLQDRFSTEIAPASQKIDAVNLLKLKEEEAEERLRKVWSGEADGEDDISTSNPWNIGEDERSGNWGEFKWESKTFSEFKAEYNKFKKENPDLKSRVQFEESLKTVNYPEWLLYTFGGQADAKNINFNYSAANAVGMNLKDANAYNQGKAAFKRYIAERNDKIFKVTNTSSDQDGFIPLDLQITMLGLSGMKIYQKLPIDVSFLPTQYMQNQENDLNFNVMNIDHKIDNNKWETNIKTLSIPRAKEVEVNVIDNSLFTFLGIDTPPATFAAYAEAIPWSAYFISWLNENIPSAATNSFPSNAAHTNYAEAVRQGGTNWFVYDPREGSSFSRAAAIAGVRLNTRKIEYNTVYNLDTLYSDSDTRSNYKLDIPSTVGVYGEDYFNNKGYLNKVKPGDIILVQDKSNKIYYNSKPWVGASHGDIVVEVTDTQIICIGGNLSNTVKKVYYDLVKNKVEVDANSLPDTTYTTEGAIKYIGSGQNIICALRCNDQNIASELVALANQEFEKWSSNGWTEQSEGAFETLRGYYLAANGLPPSLPNATE